MKKKSINRNAKAVVAASLAALPMLSSPGVTYGQKGAAPAATEMSTKAIQKMPSYYKLADVIQKIKGNLWLAGVGDGHTIYEKSDGSMFYLDEKTGDMHQVSPEVFHKGDSKDTRSRATSNTYIKIDFGDYKLSNKLTILGVDAKGNVVHQKPDGSTFTVDKRTGHVTLIKQ